MGQGVGYGLGGSTQNQMVHAQHLRCFLLVVRSGPAMQSLSVQFSSVAQSCPTLYNPMDGSMPAFPVHHQLPELTLTHVL